MPNKKLHTWNCYHDTNHWYQSEQFLTEKVDCFQCALLGIKYGMRYVGEQKPLTEVTPQETQKA
jgi:hypothetical protein